MLCNPSTLPIWRKSNRSSTTLLYAVDAEKRKWEKEDSFKLAAIRLRNFSSSSRC